MSRLIVVGGLPGTGKTTLSQALARDLGAVCLRVDVVETPLIRAGVEVGLLGYEIVWDVARSNLALGMQIVVDLVNPLPFTRRMWVAAAAEAGAHLRVFECVIPDRGEHRRRVAGRVPDLPGQVVPSWDDVLRREYVPWDAIRDGDRVVVDMTDTSRGLRVAREALGQLDLDEDR